MSQPAKVTRASKRSACIMISTESAMTSRLTSEARMPSWPMEMPSDTAMVTNSMREAARRPHAVLGPLGQPVERHVAGRDLVPAAGHAHLGLVPVVVGHADGPEHGPGRRPLVPVGHLAAPRLDVDRGLTVLVSHGGQATGVPVTDPSPMRAALRRRNRHDRDIVRLAVPAFVALVAEPLYVLADTAVVGHLGTAGARRPGRRDRPSCSRSTSSVDLPRLRHDRRGGPPARAPATAGRRPRDGGPGHVARARARPRSSAPSVSPSPSR